MEFCYFVEKNFQYEIPIIIRNVAVVVEMLIKKTNAIVESFKREIQFSEVWIKM